MSLEVATYISELVATNPVGAVDDYATADDHLRLIKSVLQSQFPNLTAAAVNPTVAEFNNIAGLSVDLSTLVATAVELNKLAGFSGTAADIELLAGQQAGGLTAADLTKLAAIVASAAEIDNLDGYTGNTADLNIVAGAAAGGLTAAELLFVAGVTSDIQTQFGGKAPTAHAHTGSEISALDTGDTTTGIFAKARIPASSQAEAEAGTDDTEFMTPLRTKQAIDALSPTSFQIKFKTANETVTNSVTLQDDDHLVGFTLVAGKHYTFEASLHLAVATNVSDFKWQLVFTNAPTDNWYGILNASVNDFNDENTEAGNINAELDIALAVSNNTQILMHGGFQANATTGGTFKLQWAQDTAHAFGLTMYESSWMRIEQLD